MTVSPPRLLGPWRRAFQWFVCLALLLIPFVRIDGRSLLRLDLARLTLEVAGTRLQIEELYLFLLLCIALILLFLLVTLVLGRVWCGWACPQTTLSDLAEYLGLRLGLRLEQGRLVGPVCRRLVLHGSFVLIGLLIGANLVWYFVSPYEFLPRLLAWDLPPAAAVTLTAVALAVYLDLAWVRRLLCRDFCPYGRFQTVLVDPGTLTLRLPEAEAGRCLDCGACVRSCPMGIDIRRGFQVECINCGRCLDACREVMARRRQPGLIRYTFGVRGRGLRALFNPRLALLALVFLAVFTALVTATVNRPRAALKLARSAAPARLLEDGRVATFFTAVVANRGAAAQALILAARDAAGNELELAGPVRDIELAAGERRRLAFALLSPAVPSRRRVDILLLDSDGRLLATGEASVLPLSREHP